MELINERGNYTKHAIEAALEELKKRNISPEQMENYFEGRILEKELMEQTANIELSLFEKIKFFFLWFLPFMGFAFQMNFAETGLKAKLSQSKGFSWIGFLTFIIVGILAGIFGHSNFESISFWILFFIPAYFLEKKLKAGAKKKTEDSPPPAY